MMVHFDYIGYVFSTANISLEVNYFPQCNKQTIL
jgi:hypothetical protein